MRSCHALAVREFGKRTFDRRAREHPPMGSVSSKLTQHRAWEKEAEPPQIAFLPRRQASPCCLSCTASSDRALIARGSRRSARSRPSVSSPSLPSRLPSPHDHPRQSLQEFRNPSVRNPRPVGVKPPQRGQALQVCKPGIRHTRPAKRQSLQPSQLGQPRVADGPLDIEPTRVCQLPQLCQPRVRELRRPWRI